MQHVQPFPDPKIGNDITPFFSNDNTLLESYIKVRKIAFDYDKQKDSTVVMPSNLEEDIYDRTSEILILTKDGECIGGSRLTISPQGDKTPLPMETETFKLEEQLPELRGHSYAELSRLAILPEYRNPELVVEVIRQLSARAKSKGVKFYFAQANAIRARTYRRASRQAGFDMEIRHDITIPHTKDAQDKWFLLKQAL